MSHFLLEKAIHRQTCRQSLRESCCVALFLARAQQYNILFKIINLHHAVLLCRTFSLWNFSIGKLANKRVGESCWVVFSRSTMGHPPPLKQFVYILQAYYVALYRGKLLRKVLLNRGSSLCLIGNAVLVRRTFSKHMAHYQSYIFAALVTFCRKVLSHFVAFIVTFCRTFSRLAFLHNLLESDI